MSAVSELRGLYTDFQSDVKKPALGLWPLALGKTNSETKIAAPLGSWLLAVGFWETKNKTKNRSTKTRGVTKNLTVFTVFSVKR